MPTGTAPDMLTFVTLGPTATIVVSCRIGSTVAMFHSLGSTTEITSPMLLEPSSAALISLWMPRSQTPVMFDGACTSAPGPAAFGGTVDAGVFGAAGGTVDAGVFGGADASGVGDGVGAARPGVETAVDSSATQP